jgi:hypothetical protein
MGGVGSMNANLMTRRRFFQSAAGSRWDEELNVVDEKVERAREANIRLGHRTLLELWTEARIGEDEDEEDDDKDMSVDS